MRLGLRSTLAVLMLAAGCSADSASSGDGDYMPPVDPPWDCEDEECPDTGIPNGLPCHGSAHCEGAVCSAEFRDGEVGRFLCQDACVPTDDQASWCMDSTACCDAAATCNPRGLCRLDPDASAGDDASADGGAATGVETSGSGDDESTGDDGPTGGDGSTGDEETSTGAEDSTGSGSSTG